MVNEKLRNLTKEQLETLAGGGMADPEPLAALTETARGTPKNQKQHRDKRSPRPAEGRGLLS